jgi:hypothetical protein
MLPFVLGHDEIMQKRLPMKIRRDHRRSKAARDSGCPVLYESTTQSPDGNTANDVDRSSRVGLKLRVGPIAPATLVTSCLATTQRKSTWSSCAIALNVCGVAS